MMKEKVQNNSPQSGNRKQSTLNISVTVIYSVAVIVFVCVLLFLLFPDPIVNWCVKPVVIKTVSDAYPGHTVQIERMKYSIRRNRIEFDSVAICSVDGKYSFTMSSISVSGIGWFHTLLGGRLVPDDAANGTVDANDIVVKFLTTQYELRCESLHASVPESLVVVKNGVIDLLGDDEQFFAGSTYRRTRFRASVPHIEILGLAGIELVQEKSYRMSSVNIRDPSLDILVNNDKKSDPEAPSPMMPNEIIASVKSFLQIDKLTITNAQVQYGERDGVGSPPAVISFDSVQIMADGIANHGGRHDDIVIHANGNFMKTGKMNVIIVIPVSSPELSFRYYGSVSRIDISELNGFLETAEHIRIKGLLQEATFKVVIVSGRAAGSVRAVYRDLSMVFIDKKTGSKNGISDRLTSFIANTFKLHKNNMPDSSGSVVAGKIHYVRKSDDPFFRFTWFALRSGVMDVAGL